MLRFIGDSHVSVFGGKDYMQPTWPNNIDSGADPSSIRTNLLKNIEQYRLGPQTAYNFHKQLDTVKSILNTFNKQDVIFFSAGEIDIREHISRVAKRDNISIEESVNNTFSNYISFLNDIYNLGYNVGILMPHLASFNLFEEDKVQAIEFFNDLCKDTKYYSIGAMDFITDESFYWDGLHLSQKCIPLFINQLKTLGLYE